MSSVNTIGSPFDGEALSETDPRCRLIEKYFSIFASRTESGIKRESETGWRFVSKYHTLSEQEVEQSLEKDANLFRAFSVEAQSDFLVVSFQAKSTYQSANFVSNIMSALKARGMKTCLYEFHGDWYLFLYFATQIDTTAFCDLFSNWCDSLGMKTGPEGICVHGIGSLVPFPLQPGFYWMNERCQKLVRRDELSLEKSIAFLISEAVKQKNDPEAFRSTFKISAMSFRAKRARLVSGEESTPGPTVEISTSQISDRDQSVIAEAVEEASANPMPLPPGSVQLAS